MKTKKLVTLYRESDFEREIGLPKRDGTGAYVDSRTPFRRDYARLIHSPAFRRLQGKTQLFPGIESDFFRNRLTHSLEVAQIADGIAIQLNTRDKNFSKHHIDTDLVQLAALAHDLGHPPFGHNGEYALDECMRDYGGFEGNAQTLRIVSRLEKRERNDTKSGGLNLTYRSLASLLKYDEPIPLISAQRKDSGKLVKGYYASETELVSTIKGAVCGNKRASDFKVVECQIMDLADDISYSTYDLEDALKAGFLTPLEIIHLAHTPEFLSKVTRKVAKAMDESIEPADVSKVYIEIFGGMVSEKLKDADFHKPVDLVKRISEIYSTSKRLAGDGHLRTAFTSELVKEFMAGISGQFNEKQPALSRVILKQETRLKIEALKHLAYEALIMSPRLKLVEYRGRDIVRGIFEAIDSKERGGHLLLPDDWRESYLSLESDELGRKRLICDFVAGMTDRYAVEFYARLTSVDSGLSFFKPM
ncbi:dGTP triphosphohydrolase [Cupriavidus taiwanensis]|uniref:Deoxyguanosinetriphosphate triphosphohydrolase-like protein n=1 Tax=Cupriavidus taiwanensis TaxID=164546 RepID=A0A375JES3_9BURK|nr:dNTP triphosphohydrolase [Cupriavidus taiwanensis]SPS03071.1 Deoxyguanosinetriphosphate triphosphohydrolase-like protein 2 [Cupriavidus taiwanensis]